MELVLCVFAVFIECILGLSIVLFPVIFAALSHSGVALVACRLGPRLVVVAPARDARLRSHAHVLLDEFVCGEVVHKVLGRNHAAVLVVFLHNDLVELAHYALHDLLELKGHRFVLEGPDVFVELLVELLDHARTPGLHLVVNEMHFFSHGFG